MKISFIGKFAHLHDEEYIARSLESIGHEVQRIPDRFISASILNKLNNFIPDIILCTKLFIADPQKVINWSKENSIPLVSWNFDLYWDYGRENKIQSVPGFKADHIFTTDGGHQDKWNSIGVNHTCIRQGIYKDECFLLKGNPEGICFIGSENNLNRDRVLQIDFVTKRYPKFKWYGRFDTNQTRGTELNTLFANTKIIIGDSVYSPFYWSNRVVETLGRGGFLIHQEVEGLKDEYPNIVTYKRGDMDDLKNKIDYYMSHEDERKEIIRLNFELVKNKYTMDKKCADLLSCLSL